MVRPNTNDGAKESKPLNLSDLLANAMGQVVTHADGFTVAPAPFEVKCDQNPVLPKDDPGFIAQPLSIVDRCKKQLAVMEKCTCPRCKLALFPVRIQEFAEAETIAAAYTGDTSKLQALCDLIEQLKAK